MEKDKLISVSYDMLYLCKCSLLNITPDVSLINSSYKDIYLVSKRHSVCSLVAYSLNKIQLNTPDYIQALSAFIESLNKSIRKTVMFDLERKSIYDFLEKNHCTYMPLKGIIIKDLYPSVGMREFADNDIWYDVSSQKKLVSFFKEKGYHVESVGKGNTDVFLKEPFYNFEMHSSLFGDTIDKRWHKYYKNLTTMLIPVSDNSYERRLSDEDFYVYTLIHEYKHYATTGTGIRSIIDNYVINQKLFNSLDKEYINNELIKLGALDFFNMTYELSNSIFTSSFDALSTAQKEILEEIFLSGTYGSTSLFVKKGLKQISKTGKYNFFVKIKYVIKRLFPNPKYMNLNSKIKFPLLYPFIYLYRIIVRLILGVPRGLRELSVLRKTKSENNKIK